MTQRQLDPDLLRSFLAIAGTGSYRAAADRVGRTPSALSMQIQRLEEIVGERLFTRDRPPVRLTGPGEKMMGYARRLLALQDETLAAFDHRAPTGRVRLGIPDDYASGILKPILVRLAADYPRLEIEITCAQSSALIPQLQDGHLDLALITHTPGRPRGKLVRREPLVWAAGPGADLAPDRPLPLAVFQPDCRARTLVTRALDRMKRSYRIAYSSPNLAGLLAVTEAGLAVAALPRSSTPPHLRMLTAQDGFPALPLLDLCLLRNPAAKSRAADALAACIADVVPTL